MNKMLPYISFSICILFVFSCTQSADTLFQQKSASNTGITFNNIIIENDSINPLDLEYLYNGGGVGIADFNNDGLQDIYFTASQVSNKLYLNKGNFTFDDITETAGVAGNGRWCNGVSVVDVNNDGLQDMYVCASIKKKGIDRTNLLYINQGIDKKGIPIFKEMAAAYGLADTAYSVQAAFFDYDKDGDVDMYLVTTKMSTRNITNFGNYEKDTIIPDADKLYRNDGIGKDNHPTYTEVSKKRSEEPRLNSSHPSISRMPSSA